jgi:DNA-binding MarR family transcriptional regulator
MKGANDRTGNPAGVRFHALGASGLVARRRRASAPSEDASELVELDPLIHERTRLAILTTLSTSKQSTCSFIHLRDVLQVTDGNLITHLRTLEQAGLVERRKRGAGRGSTTSVHLTPAGQKAFRAYLDQLETLVRAARGTANGKR